MNDSLEEFCNEYNVPLNHLGEILKDPKVIPMIRGKAFEFSVCDRLQDILDAEVWKVTKPFLNPQFNSHDEDVLIEHLETSTRISIECKLSSKGQYKYRSDTSTFRIKCMRSRTLGASKVGILAKMKELDPAQLAVHNDQYLPTDFDLVITTLANAFYSTDDSGVFVWDPSKLGLKFLEKRFGEGLSEREYQNHAYNDMYVVKSSDIAISSSNAKCTRRKCVEPDSCGFIPNYPLLEFHHDDVNKPLGCWKHISNIESILLDFVQNNPSTTS